MCQEWCEGRIKLCRVGQATNQLDYWSFISPSIPLPLFSLVELNEFFLAFQMPPSQLHSVLQATEKTGPMNRNASEGIEEFNVVLSDESKFSSSAPSGEFQGGNCSGGESFESGRKNLESQTILNEAQKRQNVFEQVRQNFANGSENLESQTSPNVAQKRQIIFEQASQNFSNGRKNLESQTSPKDAQKRQTFFGKRSLKFAMRGNEFDRISAESPLKLNNRFSNLTSEIFSSNASDDLFDFKEKLENILNVDKRNLRKKQKQWNKLKQKRIRDRCEKRSSDISDPFSTQMLDVYLASLQILPIWLMIFVLFAMFLSFESMNLFNSAFVDTDFDMRSAAEQIKKDQKKRMAGLKQKLHAMIEIKRSMRQKSNSIFIKQKLAHCKHEFEIYKDILLNLLFDDSDMGVFASLLLFFLTGALLLLILICTILFVFCPHMPIFLDYLLRIFEMNDPMEFDDLDEAKRAMHRDSILSVLEQMNNQMPAMKKEKCGLKRLKKVIAKIRQNNEILRHMIKALIFKRIIVQEQQVITDVEPEEHKKSQTEFAYSYEAAALESVYMSLFSLHPDTSQSNNSIYTIPVEIDEVMTDGIVDTGSTRTIADLNWAKEMDLPILNLNETEVGISITGSQIKATNATRVNMRMKDLQRS